MMTVEKKVMDLCKQTIPYFEKTFFNRYIQDYKDYLWYKADRQREIQDWQTNVVFPLISWMVDTMYASIYDSKFKFTLTWDWIKWTDKLLNHAFDYEWKGKQALMDAAKECIITGKWFLEPYFMYYKEKKVVRGKNYWRVIKRPVVDYVSIFDVFYDYNGTVEESPFIIKRSILSKQGIIKRYWVKLWWNANAIVEAITSSDVVEQYSQYDINRVKHIIAYEEMIKNSKTPLITMIPTFRDRWYSEQDTIDSRNNVFAVDFKKNAVYEVIEHNDDTTTTVLVDGKLLFSKPRTLWLSWPLIQSFSFNQIPWTSDSLWISSMNRDNQMVSNSLFNIYLDNLKMQIAPMFESVWWMNSFLGNKNKIEYSPYKVVPTNTPWSLRKVDLWIGWFEPVNAIQFMSTVSRERVGINEYVMWVQGKVERVAWWVDMLFNQFKSRLMPLTNSINTGMWRIAKIILLMYATYYKEAELQELGLEDSLDIAKFLDEKNVKFQLSSLNLLENEEKLEYLNANLMNLAWLRQDETWAPTINTQELVKALLTKEIDIDAILTPKEIPQQQFNQWWFPQQQWWQPPLPEEDIYQWLANL